MLLHFARRLEWPLNIQTIFDFIFDYDINLNAMFLWPSYIIVICDDVWTYHVKIIVFGYLFFILDAIN